MISHSGPMNPFLFSNTLSALPARLKEDSKAAAWLFIATPPPTPHGPDKNLSRE